MEWIESVETTGSQFEPEETGDNFIDKWKSVYNEYQWDTPHIAQATLHVMLGQLPSIRNMRIYTSAARYEDGRIHVVWMQPSGTGKQGGFDFVSDVSKNIDNFIYETKNKFTSAVLLGGPSGKRVRKWNKETHVNEEDSILKPGLLSPGEINIFACQEVGPLFDSKTEHNEESMTWLQIAMDPIGRNELTKDILSMGQTVKLFPECSIFFASYIPSEFNKKTVQRGFVQRTILIINPVPISTRKANMKKSARGLGTSVEDASELQEDSRYLGRYLNYVNEKYKDTIITIDKNSVIDPVDGVIDQIYSMVEDLPAYQQEELQKFTTRATAQVYKVSWHHCILRGDTVVTAEDVVYAEAFLNPIWRQMISYYEDALEGTSKVADAERKWNYDVSIAIEEIISTTPHRSKNGWVYESDVIDKLKKKLRKTKPTIKKKIKNSIDSGIIKRHIAISNDNKIYVVKMAKEVSI